MTPMNGTEGWDTSGCSLDLGALWGLKHQNKELRDRDGEEDEEEIRDGCR